MHAKAGKAAKLLLLLLRETEKPPEVAYRLIVTYLPEPRLGFFIAMPPSQASMNALKVQSR